MKTIAFVSNTDQKKKLNESPTTPNQIISYDQSVSSELPSAKYYKKAFNLDIEWEECVRDAVEVFNSWNEMTYQGRYIFSDILGFNDNSILDLDSVRFLSAHSELLANIIYKIKVMNKILEISSPDQVIVFSSTSEWEKITTEVCLDLNIKCKCKNNMNDIIQDNILSNTIKLSEVSDYSMPLKLPILIIPLLIKARNRWRSYTINKSSPQSNYDILFYLQNKKWYNTISPLMESLAMDGDEILMVTPQSFNIPDEVSNIDMDITYLTDYLAPNICLEINSEYNKIRKRFKKIKNDTNALDELYEIQGLSIPGLILPQLRRSYVFSNTIIFYIKVMESMISRHNPDCLIMPHHTERFAKSFTTACQSHGVPVISIKTGSPNVAGEVSTFIGDKLLVPGKSTKELFKSFGICEKKIKITGLPEFDDLVKKYERKHEIIPAFRKEHGIDNDKYILTYLTQTLSSRFTKKDRRKEIQSVYNVVSNIDEIYLIIKTHPTESNKGVYESIASDMGLEHYSIKHNSLNEALISSNFAITKTSTTGFNALISGSKLIISNFHKESGKSNHFVQQGIAPVVTTETDLHDILVDQIESSESPTDTAGKRTPDIMEFLDYHYTNLGRGAAENMKKEIRSSVER